MKIVRDSLTIALIISCVTLSGCEALVTTGLVENRHTDRWETIDPNDYGIAFDLKEDGAFSYSWKLTLGFDNEQATIPCWKQKQYSNSAVVCGYLNDTPYPIIFDTGNSLGLFIEDLHINRHNLNVFFFDPNSTNSDGLAIVPSLQVGPVTFKDYPCSFYSHRRQHRLLGILPIYRFNFILLPLDLMSAFSAIEFDGIGNQLTLIEKDSFEPENPNEWIVWPFDIQNKHLLINLSVESLPATVFLDTGADHSLQLRQAFADKLFAQRPDLLERRHKKTTCYYPYAGGELDAKKVNAPTLKLNNETLHNIKLIYTMDAAKKKTFPYAGTDGTMGLGLFQKTRLVLDFKKKQLWILKAEGSYFAEYEHRTE